MQAPVDNYGAVRQWLLQHYLQALWAPKGAFRQDR